MPRRGRKTRKAGEAGPHMCFCGSCECETQDECLDPATECPCQASQTQEPCCSKPKTDDGPQVVVEQEEREPIFV